MNTKKQMTRLLFKHTVAQSLRDSVAEAAFSTEIQFARREWQMVPVTATERAAMVQRLVDLINTRETVRMDGSGKPLGVG